MNRATRDKLTSATTPASSLWETPPLIYQALDQDFGPFDVDLTADPERHCCPTWLGPGSIHAQDALTAPWSDYGRRGYSNPPYGPFLAALLPVARQQALTHGFESTILMPLRVTRAFAAHVLMGAAELHFCDRRITFFERGVPRLNEKACRAGKAVADAAVFDSIIVRYRPRHVGAPRLAIWQVPRHVTTDDLALAMARRTAMDEIARILNGEDEEKTGADSSAA